MLIYHGMWNTVIIDASMGSFLKITTYDLKTYTIAAVLMNNNISHSANKVANML